MFLHDIDAQVIDKIKEKSRHGRAAQIQRVWRRYKKEKDKRIAAAKAREDMMQDLVNEVGCRLRNANVFLVFLS